MPRVSLFTQDIADAICELLADGKALRTICEAEDMPHRATVFRWLAADPAFAEQYGKAREAQADALADDIVAIADECRKGTKTVRKANGDVEVTEIDMIERARLQVDARKWVAAKLKPKKYGDQMRTELTGENGGALLIGISTRPKVPA